MGHFPRPLSPGTGFVLARHTACQCRHLKENELRLVVSWGWPRSAVFRPWLCPPATWGSWSQHSDTIPCLARRYLCVHWLAPRTTAKSLDRVAKTTGICFLQVLRLESPISRGQEIWFWWKFSEAFKWLASCWVFMGWEKTQLLSFFSKALIYFMPAWTSWPIYPLEVSFLSTSILTGVRHGICGGSTQ